MSEPLALDDAQARRQAAEPRDSILLEAPAGAGKTAVLTQRFLRLLCTVDEPGQILAITFTRKAAAEMHARVTRALKGQLTGEDAGTAALRTLAAAALAHGAARGWRLAEEPQGLRIQTIDAFNYWLASQLPVAAKAGGALEVTESAQSMYLAAARSTLIAAEADRELAPDVQLLFERFDNHWANIEGMLAHMLAERAHWLPYVLEQPAAQLCARVSASLAAVTAAQLARAVALLPQGLRVQLERLPGVTGLTAAAAALPHWQQLAHLTRTGTGWRARLSAHLLGEEFQDPALRGHLKQQIQVLAGIAGAGELLGQLQRWPHSTLTADDAAALAALSRLLAQAAAHLQQQFAQHGRVDYTFIMGAARAALAEAGEPTELALRTGLALRHILVDEFQDTSLAQFQLLATLTASWEQGDGRTLFVVGDPMQSIYRFREAEVGLFLAARDAGIGTVPLRPLRLRRNFRSAPELVQFTNELFASVFPAVDDLREGAVAYHRSIAARPAAPAVVGPRLSLKLFPQDRPAEAAAVALRIAAVRSADPTGRIAILVAAHVHATPIIQALGARGVPCVGVDLVPLRERVVVRDLVQLTCALYDLADRNAWLAVLRAPWCGAGLHTLSVLSGQRETLLVYEALGDARRLARVTAADLARLGRVHAVLAAALARRGSEPVADWLEATWVQLGASDAYEPAELADARVFFAALAERAAAFEWRGPADFPALLQRLFSAALAAHDNPVQVMTIHRAKGLEFEHVFVPCLDRKPGGGERRLLRWIDLPNEAGTSDLIIAPAPAIGEHEEMLLDRFLKGLLNRREVHERTRLMYVAATRARETLWLSGAPQVAEDGAPRPAANSLLSCVWPALADRFERPDAAAAPVSAAHERPGLRRLGAAGVRRSCPPRRSCRTCRSGRWRWSRRSSAGSGKRSARSARSCTAISRAWPKAALPATPAAIDGQEHAVLAQLARARRARA